MNRVQVSVGSGDVDTWVNKADHLKAYIIRKITCSYFAAGYLNFTVKVLEQSFLRRFDAVQANVNCCLAAVMILVFKNLVHQCPPCHFIGVEHLYFFTPFINVGILYRIGAVVIAGVHIVHH